MGIQSYEDLVVWQKAMDLADAVYDLVNTFPKDEQFGLTAQIKRAAVAIPSNIAEGSRRQTTKDFRHFVAIAFGSGAELETQLKIAKRRNFSTMKDYERVEGLLDEVMKMLNKLFSSLK